MRELENVNYQKELEKLIEQHQKEGKVPRLFLHACCAPCSSYVLEYLSRFFSVTVFFYNPNISPKEEYDKRVAEIRRLISEMEFLHPVTLVGIQKELINMQIVTLRFSERRICMSLHIIC